MAFRTIRIQWEKERSPIEMMLVLLRSGLRVNINMSQKNGQHFEILVIVADGNIYNYVTLSHVERLSILFLR